MAPDLVEGVAIGAEGDGYSLPHQNVKNILRWEEGVVGVIFSGSIDFDGGAIFFEVRNQFLNVGNKGFCGDFATALENVEVGEDVAKAAVDEFLHGVKIPL